VLSLQHAIPGTVVPLWLLIHGYASAWAVGVLVVVVNTLLVTTLQVPAARGSEEVAASARKSWYGGPLAALACLLFALSAEVTSAAEVIAVLVGAVAVHALPEFLGSAGTWGLSFELTPPGRHGEYQGAWGMASQVAQIVAPLLFTAALTWRPVVAWFGFPAVFVLAGTALRTAAGSAGQRCT
jgi:hypothetical protein